MKFDYQLDRPYIEVGATIYGSTGQITTLTFLVDTGAARTLISPTALEYLGYEPSTATERVRMTTVSGIEYSPVLQIRKIESLGLVKEDFPVVLHTLPPNAPIDGLLGMDFIQGHVLTIDTIAHTIELI